MTHQPTAINDLDLCSALQIVKKQFYLLFDCDWVFHRILMSNNNKNNNNSSDDFIQINYSRAELSDRKCAINLHYISVVGGARH